MWGRRMLRLGVSALAVASLAGCYGLPVGPHLSLRGPATVTGQVTDAETGAAVAGAAVLVEGAGALQVAQTDGRGRYRLQVVWTREDERGDSGAQLATRVVAQGYRLREVALRIVPGSLARDLTIERDERPDR